MKYFASILAVTLFLTAGVGAVFAAPFNPNFTNPNVVSYYPGPNDLHTIVGEEGQAHYGEDLVMERGQSGKFHQWFYGTSQEEGLHGEHTIFNLTRPDGTCPNGWTLMEDLYPDWGYHFEPGQDYCVRTHDFHPSH